MCECEMCGKAGKTYETSGMALCAACVVRAFRSGGQFESSAEADAAAAEHMEGAEL